MWNPIRIRLPIRILIEFVRWLLRQSEWEDHLLHRRGTELVPPERSISGILPSLMRIWLLTGEATRSDAESNSNSSRYPVQIVVESGIEFFHQNELEDDSFHWRGSSSARENWTVVPSSCHTNSNSNGVKRRKRSGIQFEFASVAKPNRNITQEITPSPIWLRG